LFGHFSALESAGGVATVDVAEVLAVDAVAEEALQRAAIARGWVTSGCTPRLLATRL
jgi:hypothetical protein